MELRELQAELTTLAFYHDAIDGIDGKNTRKAVDALIQTKGLVTDSWTDTRRKVAAEQIIYANHAIEVGNIDGLVGEQTRYARQVWAAAKVSPEARHIAETWRDQHFLTPTQLPTNTAKLNWPTQAGVPGFYGEINSHQVTLEMPFPLVLDWEPTTVVKRVSCHSKVHDAMQLIWTQALAHYGYERLCALRLNRFGGCLNPRKMRGGSAWSMHSWGIAWDIDPERNQLRWGRDRASLDATEYDEFWKIVESQGASSLGRSKNYDWMHFQFANFG